MNLGGTVHINKVGCCLLLGIIIILFLYMFSNRNVSQEKTLNQVNLYKLLNVAIIAAEEGGREVVNSKNDLKIESKGKTKEGASDFVTTADFNSHCAIINRLEQSFPTINIISEEHQTVCKPHLLDSVNSSDIDSKLQNEWIDENNVKLWIDPLDATQEYTEKLYQFVTVMVCVAVNGKPVIGVIHKPFEKETFWAWVNKGHSKNFDTNQEFNENILRFIVSRSHTGQAKELIEKMFNGNDIKILEAGGAGYKILEVVNDRADVYLHITAIKKWDVCAGNAILNAFGGKLLTRKGEEIDYADSKTVLNEDGIVATQHNQKFNVS